ncbi:MAG: DsbA family oxidoreductase [Parerythrobacter sp.]
MTARTLDIAIWSDIMCPWCLVGWGQLQQALAALDGEIAADIRWLPFELNPDMPANGEERTAHIAKKYRRSVADAKAVQVQMATAARDAGVSLDYTGPDPAPPAMMWNTFDAHVLLAWALEAHDAARQTELKLELFAAHFHRREKIGRSEVLLALADRLGFDRSAAAAALDDEELQQKVRVEQAAAREANITGVPAMVIGGTFLVPGAQGRDTYVNVLRRVAQKTA